MRYIIVGTVFASILMYFIRQVDADTKHNMLRSVTIWLLLFATWPVALVILLYRDTETET